MEFMQWYEFIVWLMNEKFWDEDWGIYNVFDLCVGEIIFVYMFFGFILLCGEVFIQEQAEAMLCIMESFVFGGKDFGILFCFIYSLQVKDINYKKYWCGLVWINFNWLFYYGLMWYDMIEMVDCIWKYSLELFFRYGFYEYFDFCWLVEGEIGCGIDQFLWLAVLCFDFLQGEMFG